MALKDGIREQILDVGHTLYPYCSCSHDTKRLCEGHRKLVERATALVSKALQEAEELKVREPKSYTGDTAYDIGCESGYESGVEEYRYAIRELREGLKG